MTIVVQLGTLSPEQQQVFFRQVNRCAGDKSVAAESLYAAGSPEATIQAYLADNSLLTFNDSVVREALLNHFGLTRKKWDASIEITVPDEISGSMEADSGCAAIVSGLVTEGPQQMRVANEAALKKELKARFEGQYYISQGQLYKATFISSEFIELFSEEGHTANVTLELTTTMAPAATISVETTVKLPNLHFANAVDDLYVYPETLSHGNRVFNQTPSPFRDLDFDTFKQVIVKAADAYIAHNEKYRGNDHNKDGLERVKQLKRDIAVIDINGQEGIQALTRALGACFHSQKPSPGAKDFSFISFLLQDIKGYDLSPLNIPQRPLLNPLETYKQSHGGQVAVRKQFMHAIAKPDNYVPAPRAKPTESLTAEALSAVIMAAAGAYTAVHKGKRGKDRANQLSQAREMIMRSDLDEAGKLAALIRAVKVCLHPNTFKKPGTRNDSLVAFLLEGTSAVPGLKAYDLLQSLGIIQDFYPEDDYTDHCQAELRAFLNQLTKPTSAERTDINAYVLSHRKLNEANSYEICNSSEPVSSGKDWVIYDSANTSPSDTVLDEDGAAVFARFRAKPEAPVNAGGSVASMDTQSKNQRSNSFDGRAVVTRVSEKSVDSV